MKNALVVFVALIFVSSILISKEITTTNKGGMWSSKKTWIKGKIPSVQDTVLITSKVTVDKDCQVSKVIMKENSTLIINANKQLKTFELERPESANIQNNGIIEVGR